MDSPARWAFSPACCIFLAPFAVLAIAGEFFGGLSLIFGLFTRVAAFGIFCNMAVAVAMIHHQFGLFMNWAGTQKGEGFEFHLLALAITVFLLIRGAGAASVDRLWSSSGKNSIRGQVLAASRLIGHT
jgi:uncharacterized membrane protein YphA (DoxX/SURF4 family)